MFWGFYMQPNWSSRERATKKPLMDMEEIRVFFPGAFREESIREKVPENRVYGEVLVSKQWFEVETM